MCHQSWSCSAAVSSSSGSTLLLLHGSTTTLETGPKVAAPAAPPSPSRDRRSAVHQPPGCQPARVCLGRAWVQGIWGARLHVVQSERGSTWLRDARSSREPALSRGRDRSRSRMWSSPQNRPLRRLGGPVALGSRDERAPPARRYPSADARRPGAAGRASGIRHPPMECRGGEPPGPGAHGRPAGRASGPRG
jgi:hypothetical protein